MEHEIHYKMEEIRQQIQASAVLNKPYLLMNALAALIACYGLLADSTAVVIGAMVVAMLLGPITGIALGLLEDSSNRLLRQAFFAEVVGVVLVLGLAFMVGKLHQDIPAGKEILSRTVPNLFDLIIALAGGAAGAYAVASPRINVGLIGVAIATALVPPLSACGILLARGETELASGAFLLFFTNFVAIQFASSVVLWLLGYNPVRTSTYQSLGRLLARNAISGALLVGLALTFSVNLTQSVSKRLTENKTVEALNARLVLFPDAQLVEFSSTKEKDVLKLEVTVRTSRQLAYTEVMGLQRKLAEELKQPIALKLINIPTVKLDTLNPPPPPPTDAPETSRLRQELEQLKNQHTRLLESLNTAPAQRRI